MGAKESDMILNLIKIEYVGTKQFQEALYNFLVKLQNNGFS